MFKSCQYCRHRKKKCVFPEDSKFDRRCFGCQDVGVACEIAPRQRSIKRQRTSQLAAARVKHAFEQEHGTPLKASRPGTIVVGMEDGDCQIPRPGTSSDRKQLLHVNVPELQLHLDTKQIYESVVYPDFPFVPEEYLESPVSPTLTKCIRQAARLSFSYRSAMLSSSETYEVNVTIAEPLDLAQISGLLLLLPRQRFEQSQMEKVFQSILETTRQRNIPQPILVGGLVAETWHCLIAYTSPTLSMPIENIANYASHLDRTAFGHHFLKMTHLAASLLQALSEKTETTLDLMPSWARLEYSSLLSVVEMPSEYLDVRDDMPASPAAVVTHMLQNLIYLRLYKHLLSEKPTLGKALALQPVPGVLHFLCAIARSTFICQPQIFEYWPQLSDVQAVAAETMLSLWDLTGFENCRALLNLWKPQAEHNVLAQQAHEAAGEGPWAVEVIDGYSVFWTFRDVRSLVLESIIHG